MSDTVIDIQSFVRKQKRIRLIGILYAIIPFIIGSLWIYISSERVQKLSNEYNAKRDKVDSLNFESGKLQNSLEGARKEYLIARGFNQQKLSMKEVVSQSIKADSLLTILIKNSHIDEKLNIVYFQKNLDEQKTVISLKEIGYTNISNRQSMSIFDSTETNGLIIGSKVQLADIKIVALSLMRAGFLIRVIEYFNNDKGKENTMQVIGVVHSDGRKYDKAPLSPQRTFNANQVTEVISSR